MFLKLLRNGMLTSSSPIKNVFMFGKRDPVTGAFLPNKKYYELYGEDADIADFQTSSVMKPIC